MFIEYFFLITYGLVTLFIVFLIPFFSYILVYQNSYKEKTTSYECGFEPFEKHMPQFEIRYYLLAILFLIFDLELAFLMPWIVNLDYLSIHAIFSMYFFFFFLVLAYYYE